MSKQAGVKVNRRTPVETVKVQGPPKRKSHRHRGLVLYLLRHLQACIASCGQIRRSPFTSLMILVVIGVALALPTGLFVLLNNATQLSAGWNQSRQISLYLKQDVNDSAAETIVNQVKNEPGVADAQYISPEQGLKTFKQQSDFGSAFAALQHNPLPGVIVVQPAINLQTTAAIQNLLANLRQIPQTDMVKLDLDWVKRLFAIIHLANRLVIALAILFGVGVLLVIGNTIHLSMQRYKQEIRVLKLVGATNAFIRRPFLYTGMLYGLLGGICAWIVVGLVLWSLASASVSVARLYGSSFYLHNLSFSGGIVLLVISGILGWLGSRIAVNKQLKTV